MKSFMSSSFLLLLLPLVAVIIGATGYVKAATLQDALSKTNSQGVNAINQEDKELAESSSSFSPYTDRRYLGGYGSYYGGGYGAGYTGGYGSGHYGSYYNSYNSRYPDYYGYNGYPGYYPSNLYVSPRLSVYPYSRFGSGYGYNAYPSSYYASNYANSVVGGGLGALGTPPFVPSLGASYNYNPIVTGTAY